MDLTPNTQEDFVREIRTIAIYPSSAITFQQNMEGTPPNIDDVLYASKVNPEDYERKLPTKRKEGNNYYEVDINYPLLRMNKEFRAAFYENFNKKGFAAVLHSNTEMMILGNDREPLSIDFIDGIKDNGSGNDQFNINITGNTIIPPKVV